MEYFQLTDDADGTTRVDYRGELGTDGWAIRAWWGRQVARAWQATVQASLATVKTEAERRASGRTPPP